MFMILIHLLVEQGHLFDPKHIKNLRKRLHQRSNTIRGQVLYQDLKKRISHSMVFTITKVDIQLNIKILLVQIGMVQKIQSKSLCQAKAKTSKVSSKNPNQAKASKVSSNNQHQVKFKDLKIWLKKKKHQNKQMNQLLRRN